MRTAIWALCLTLIFAWMVLGQAWEPWTAMWTIWALSISISLVGILIVMKISDEPGDIWREYTRDIYGIGKLVARAWRRIRSGK